MKTLITVLIISLLQCCYAPPVTKNEKEQPEQSNPAESLDFIPYSEYLKQVVKVLESDEGFKKKLEEANEEDIKSGKIAHELDFVSHRVRTKLDELKRIELDRLRNLKNQLTEEQRLDNKIIGDPLHGHLDRSNKQSFEIEDLKKLISKTTQDLADADKQRREDFKQYELQKEYEKQDKLNHTNGTDERIKLENELKEMEEKHKKHEPLHEPGHKAQLEEVWQEQDQMQQKFDPIAFFMMHDVDSNGYWDQNEVKALFIKELDKLYEQGVAEDDIREREEEMERMRETVFKEMDHNLDGFISRREFVDQTKRNEFEQDHGWKGIDEQTHPYSDEELQQYIRQQQNLQQHPAYQGQYPPPANYHPNQVPQGYPPPSPGQYYQGQQPLQYAQPNQPPPDHYQQPPQYQQVPNQLPPVGQNYHPSQYQPAQGQAINPPPQYQQPAQGQAPNQPLPPPHPPVQQQYQPPQNQPSPPVNPPLNSNEHYAKQVNPHQAGKPIQAP